MSAGLREVTLPDGARVWCLRPREVRIIYETVQEYFRHGIAVSDGDVVFDVGANIGLFAHCVYQRGHRGVSVYSFEPIPDVYEALRANTLRRSGERWTALPCGLGRRAGITTFAYTRLSMLSTAYPDTSPAELCRWRRTAMHNVHLWPGGLRWIARLPRGLRDPLLDLGLRRALHARSVDCPVRTVSDVLRAHDVSRIDLLKVDVEKAEMDVLAGIVDDDWPKIRQIVVEVHDHDGRVAEARDLLSRHGFEVVSAPEQTRAQIALRTLHARRPRADAALAVTGRVGY